MAQPRFVALAFPPTARQSKIRNTAASWPLDLPPALSNTIVSLVPLAGLEPARCCHHLILSQARLPIPPQGPRADYSGGRAGVNGWRSLPLPASGER